MSLSSLPLFSQNPRYNLWSRKRLSRHSSRPRKCQSFCMFLVKARSLQIRSLFCVHSSSGDQLKSVEFAYLAGSLLQQASFLQSTTSTSPQAHLSKWPMQQKSLCKVCASRRESSGAHKMASRFCSSKGVICFWNWRATYYRLPKNLSPQGKKRWKSTRSPPSNPQFAFKSSRML